MVLAIMPLAASSAPELVERRRADSLAGPPFVSAEAWGIFDRKSGDLLWGEAVEDRRAIASTTKIMTALVVLREAERDPSLLEEIVIVSKRADETRGSSARITEGERVVLRDLLYGLLLPSGNDASVALAETVGRRILDTQNEEDPGVAAGGGDAVVPTDESAHDAFVDAMNQAAKDLGMANTSFANPHGLDADGHESTVLDLAKVTLEAWKHPLFQEIVNTREYRATLATPDGGSRETTWKNTNHLLETEGFYGVKTGTTRRAGACLVSMGRRGNDDLLVIVLGSAASSVRYVDSQNLYRFAWLQLGHKPVEDRNE